MDSLGLLSLFILIKRKRLISEWQILQSFIFCTFSGNTPIVCYDKETFLIPQSATTVMRMKEQIYNSPLINDSKLMQLYDGLTEDSNPVLFLLHIKSI